MKTLLNFQRFEMESQNSFLNVSTKEELKKWKKLLRQYYFLRNMGVKVSKANRKAMFETLNELKATQTELTIMIDNNWASEKKEAHAESITNLTALLFELSEIQDKIEVEINLKPRLKTMIYFESIEKNDDGLIIFKNKKGKKFTMLNSDNYDKHCLFVQKYFDMIADRKKAEKKALKAQVTDEQKAQKKSDNFTEKVFEKKRQN